MFDIALFIALVVLIATYTTWRTHKREQATTKRAGRHRAEDRPTMTWRG